MDNALFIGRFQPFHLGHFKMVEYLLKGHDHVSLVIGSSQESFTEKNPFTFDERKQMVLSCFPDCKRILVLGLEDSPNDNEVWIRNLLSVAPKFNVAYSHNPLVQSLLREKGFTVKDILFQREMYEGTRIRKLLGQGKGLGLVPTPVLDYLKKIKGMERLKKLGHGTL
ncbi:MAG: nicotinamide-nucleotide adenylyltransferase [Candidatus Micrarchaeota archaeon]